MSYDVILFDLDGTLTDSKPGITRSVQYALAKLGIREDDLDKLEAFIGPPLVESFARYYSLEGEAGWQAVGYYREYFTSRGMFENRVYPGIPDLLAELRQEGKRLCVATSKPAPYAKKILDHFELDSYFEVVMGSNLDGTLMAKDQVIGAVLDRMGDVDGDRAVMVGDREHDVFGGREKGLKVIAVTYGYGSEEELAAAAPDFVAASVADLKALLSSPL